MKLTQTNMTAVNKHVISGFFLKNFKFTYLIVLAIILLGLLSVYSIPKESAPEVKIPIAVVSTPYPGASALDVEELVTDKLEDKILSLSGLDKVTSTSAEGLSSIVVSFDANEDLNESIRLLKEKVDDAKIDLPDEAETVRVTKISLSDEPIINLAFSGPYGVHQLKQMAEGLADEIKKISKVSEVNVVGGQDREIQIVVDKSKLELYNLSLSAVTNAIRQANSNLPVGSIETDEFKYNVRLQADVVNPNEIEWLPVTSYEGVPILVRDIANVYNGYAEQTSIAQFSQNDEPAISAVTIQIKKETGGNILKLSESVQKTSDNYVKTLPEGVQIVKTLDLADYIQRDLTNLTKNGISTVILVFLIIFFFLGWKESLVASFSIPLTFLTTFFILNSVGYTLNFMTLFSLILSLGILVDSTIVMTESIHKYYKSGLTIYDAALKSLVDYRWPLTSGTFTTVAAFVPVLFMSGIMGEYMRSIPVTVTFVLISSLIVALLIIPTIATTAFTRPKVLKRLVIISVLGILLYLLSQGYWIKTLIFVVAILVLRVIAQNEISVSGIFTKLTQWYKSTLKELLLSRSQKMIFLGITLLLFFGAIALIPTGLLKVVMFEEVDQTQFYINVTMPVGTPIEQTLANVEQIKDKLYSLDQVTNFTLSVGGAGSRSSNLANFVVSLTDPKERDIKSLTIIDDLRTHFSNTFHDGDIEIRQEGAGPPTSAPIVIKFIGPELEVLENLSADMENYLRKIPGTAEVKNSVDEVGTEFSFKLDKTKAAYYGVTSLQIASELRTAVYGANATTIRYEGDDIDVKVQMYLNSSNKKDDRTKTTLNYIKALPIPTRYGNIALSGLTDVSLDDAQSTIKHEDGDRIISALSDLQPGFKAVDIFTQAQAYADSMEIPDGYSIVMGGEDEDLQQSFTDLFNALIIGILLITSILVLQFNSFKQPIFILLTLPLSFIGVLPGLAALNLQLSFPAFFGIIALAGIVVNNAIILIDRINYNRRAGMTKYQAIIEAAPSRLQPIVLTTITTVVGVLPLALSQAIWGALGFSLIFGLLVSTVLTLYVIPIIYLKFAEKELS